MKFACPECNEVYEVDDLSSRQLESTIIKKWIRYVYKKLCNTIGEHLAGSIMMRDQGIASWLKKEDKKKFGV